MAATVLGGLKPECTTETVQGCLVTLVSEVQDLPVRVAAVHAMFRLRCLPVPGIDSVCAMLFEIDANARKVALLALKPFIRSAAATIVGRVAVAAPERWTSEALLALALSAGDDTKSQGAIEDFVMRCLPGTQLLPTGIAAYIALAQINPKGGSLPALLQIAEKSTSVDHCRAAMEALGDLGESARPVAAGLARILLTTDDPALEELLCQTLVRLRPPLSDLPIERTLERVENASDKAVAAHCMLLCLFPKELAKTAINVSRRFVGASEALRQVLSQTHKTLTGVELSGASAAERS
jgi:hypothetical protein